MLAVSYQGVAIPLMWTSLGKAGNSSTKERCLLLNRFILLFGRSRIRYLTADREFKGGEWLLYLKKNRIPFVIRIANDTKTTNRHKTGSLKVTRLFPLAIGESMLLNRPRVIWGIPVYLAAIRLDSGEYLIVASYDFRPNIIKDYQRRWEIETLFGCLKTRGFDLEKTRLSDPERVSKLLALLSITFVWCFRVGQWKQSKKKIKCSTHGRLMKSVFRLGLDTLQRLLFSHKANTAEWHKMLFFISPAIQDSSHQLC